MPGRGFWLPLADTGSPGGGTASFPRRHYIDPIERPYSGQFTTWTLTLSNPILSNDATAAQNDEAIWPVGLDGGTWALAMFHYRRNVRPIYTFALSSDGVGFTNVGIIDGYSGTASGAGDPTRSTITGITVATAGEYLLRMKLATRNASATGWSGAFSGIGLVRTGA